MPRWRTTYLDALRLSSPAGRPPRQAPASAAEMLATREQRAAQLDAAMRQASRAAAAAGRPPPKRTSVARRLQRYARGDNRPDTVELARLRRVDRYQRGKVTKLGDIETNLARLNRYGGTLAVDRPVLKVYSERRARPRGHVDARFEPGDLDDAVDALRERDWERLDEEMTRVVLNARYFNGALSGIDTEIIEAGQTQFLPGL